MKVFPAVPCALASILVCVAASAQPSPNQTRVVELKPGVVVESVAKDSTAAKMGFATDDVILRWTRGSNSGPIESPFDLLDVEIDQLPLGAVVLEGRRGAETANWTWRESQSWTVREGVWGLTVRPNFSGPLQSGYAAGLEAADSGKIGQAVELWQAAQKAAEASKLPSWLSAWFLTSSAQSFAGAKEWDQADSTCQRAADLLQPDRPSARVDLLRICGDAFLQRNQDDKGEKYYQLALSVVQQTRPQSLSEASLLTVISRQACNRGDLERCMQIIERVLAIREQLAPESLAIASTLNRIGHLSQLSGDLQKGEGYMRRSLALRERLALEGSALPVTLENLGNILVAEGNYAAAAPYHFRSLELWQKLAPDSLSVAAIFLDISNGLQLGGDLAGAEAFLRRALAIQMKLAPKGYGAAQSLNNLGLVLQQRSQLAEAESAYRQALAIKNEIVPGSPNVASTLSNLGEVTRLQGDLGRAEEYLQQALAIHEKASPRSLETAQVYENLGSLAAERGDSAKAEMLFRKALAIAEAAAPGGREEMYMYQHLGDLAQRGGDLAAAEKLYRSSQEIGEKLSLGSAQYADSLISLAEIARQKQQWTEAIQLFEQALQALESQNSRLGGSEEVRAGFRGSYESYYKEYVGLLISQNQPETAFRVLEQSRARTLLETLAAGRVDIRQGVDRSLLEQGRSLQASITAKLERRIQWMSEKRDTTQIARLDSEIKDLRDQYQAVQAQIGTGSPFYAALTQPQTFSAKDVQQLLDQNTLLLEYSLGEEHSYVFSVTRDSIQVHELPRRTDVEQLVRSVYDALTARNRRLEKEDTGRRQTRWAQADQEYVGLAGRLSRMVLGPVAEELREKRLLIVADGALQYIPFAALPAPGTRAGRPAPMILKHEIVSLPSASILAVLRRQGKQRSHPAKVVAVLADPVFSVRDARFGSGTRPQSMEAHSPPPREISSPADDLLTRSVRDVGLDLSRLPFTRREAEAILSLAPPNQAMRALDFDATRAAATSQDLSQYRIVHFATHGLLDSRQPELSGLVLSLVDKRGQPQSGFLALEDIYNLNLPVDLVVLSACETGLGKEIKGEGLIGLTRGFMYAGAGRVVATLWSVNDLATSELMRRFYQGVLHQKLPPAAALRSAQRDLWEHTRWKSPYYWAAFQLQGDWK